jgi:hypothetical protein
MRHHDAGERDALLVLHGVADHHERLGRALAVGHDVVRLVEIALVDLGARHEAFDVDRVRALDRDRLELVVVDRHVLALADLVAAALVRGIDRVAGLLVHHQLAQAMAGPGVDLVEMRLLGLRCRREELDRAGDEGEAQMTFPIGARHRHSRQ